MNHRRCRIGIMALAAVLVASHGAHAQSSSDEERSTVVWVNSFYGRNNSGMGMGMRWNTIGIGGTLFGFAGDTTSPLPPRPGGTGFTIDLYLAIDFSDNFAIYGNAGYVGRTGTDSGTTQGAVAYEEPDPISLGGGVQVTLLSQLVLGFGYNAIIATKSSDELENRHAPITSFIGQIGWRF